MVVRIGMVVEWIVSDGGGREEVEKKNKVQPEPIGAGTGGSTRYTREGTQAAHQVLDLGSSIPRRMSMYDASLSRGALH